MLLQHVVDFTPIRTPHEAVVNFAAVDLHRTRLFPFSCSTFSKSSFSYEQEVGERHLLSVSVSV